MDATNLTRGPSGTTGKYTILRDDQEFEVSIIREKIKLDIASVDFRNDIAIIDINQFTSALSDDFAKIAAQIKERRIRGIVLDLRNNGGGLVNTAVDLLGYFLPKGAIIASQEFRPGLESQNIDYRTERNPIFRGMQIIVLVNRGTASASEIVAAALQDHNAASILGEQTFGKGTVQEINFFGDGTALKMTVAHWLSPHQQEIQENGVTPDFEGIDDPETLEDEALNEALSRF
jgi:carboxyl-terminal processing protease